jgi:hypothetical protein
MKKTLIITAIVLLSTSVQSQDFYKMYQTFESYVYPYSIKIPKTFTKAIAQNKNIDLKFADQYGSSILVNVTPRLAGEYKITPHDQTKSFLETGMRSVAPNYSITRLDNIYVAGQKAQLIESIGGVNPRLKMMECTVYYKNKVYLITGTAEKDRFDNYRQLFENAIYSIDFK